MRLDRWHWRRSLLGFGVGMVALAAAHTAIPQQQEQPVADVRRAAELITAAELRRHVEYLASDALMGRSTPSPGLDSAVAYVSRELERLGVEPFGDNRGWCQRYTVTRTFLDTVRTSGALRYRVGAAPSPSVAASESLQYGRHFALTNFLGAGVVGGEIVYVGTGIRAPRLGLDPYSQVDVRGKWVLVHHSNALPAGVSRGSLGASGVDYTTVSQEARARGAKGILVVPFGASLADVAATRPMPMSSRDLDPPSGWAYSADPLPRVTLSRELLGIVLAGEPTDASELLRADTTGAYPAAFRLSEGKSFELNVAGEAESVHPCNVVGFIRGTHPEFGEQYISVGAHLDGWVGRGAVNGDSIFNAADDNASGSAGLLSVARALMNGPRPRRSIVLLWDTGEESGLWGSRHMANSPFSQKIVVHMNVDMIGRSKVPGTDLPEERDLALPGEVYVSGPGVLSDGMDRVVRRVERDFPYTTHNRRFDSASESFFYPRTDAAPFLEKGIPFVQFFTGLHGDYHRQGDEGDKLDFDKIEAVSRTVYATLWFLADEPRRLYMDKALPPNIAAILDRDTVR